MQNFFGLATDILDAVHCRDNFPIWKGEIIPADVMYFALDIAKFCINGDLMHEVQLFTYSLGNLLVRSLCQYIIFALEIAEMMYSY